MVLTLARIAMEVLGTKRRKSLPVRSILRRRILSNLTLNVIACRWDEVMNRYLVLSFGLKNTNIFLGRVTHRLLAIVTWKKIFVRRAKAPVNISRHNGRKHPSTIARAPINMKLRDGTINRKKRRKTSWNNRNG